MKIVILSLLISLPTLAQNTPAQSRAAAPFNFEKLVEIIRTQNLRSVDAVLPKLPLPMRQDFTLMHESLSLQKADAMHPRAILFNEDASLTCTFGGNPKLEGFETLECFQFRAESRSFDFREIVFPTAENKLRQAVVSESNQRALSSVRCTACHGQDPRPNWEQYQTWPGAYGSHDDSYQATSFDHEMNSKLEQEAQSFLRFKASIKGASRYANLVFGKTALSPYSEILKNNDASLRPNAKLTTRIAQLNAKRNARRLEARPRSEQFEFLLGVADCYDNSTEKALAKNFSLFDWFTSFRAFDQTCQNCSFPASSLASLQRYHYLDGLTIDANNYVAHGLIEKMVSRGDLPSEVLEKTRTYARTNEDDTQKLYTQLRLGEFTDKFALQSYCPLLNEKMKGAHTNEKN